MSIKIDGVLVSGKGANGVGVPPGGAEWDILKKNSDTDYDTIWGTLGQLGAELVNPVNPVGTALSGKAALSAQQTLEKIAITGHSEDVAAAELPAYIANLPRLRTENLTVNVGAGHVPGTLDLRHFYGPGQLWFLGADADSGGTVLDNGIIIYFCSNRIRLMTFEVRGENVTTAILIDTAAMVNLEGITADGADFAVSANNGVRPISSTVGISSCTVKNFTRGVYAGSGSIVWANNCAGSGNTDGFAAETGSIIFANGTTPNLMGGSTNDHWGGAIFNKTGTLI